MEEPAPSRDHLPVPALRPPGRPQGQAQGLWWLFPFFLRVTFSLLRALPSRPTEQTGCTTASSDVRITGKLKLVEERCISSGFGGTERGLWGTQKHHSTRPSPASPMDAAVGHRRGRVRLEEDAGGAGKCSSPEMLVSAVGVQQAG